MPLLEFDGQKLPQSVTIARFLAREFDLVGKNNAEAAKADAVSDTVADMLNSLIALAASIQDPKAKQEAVMKFATEQLPKHLANLEKLASMYGSSGFAVGTGLTWADLYIFESTFTFASMMPTIMDKYPALKKIRHTVETHPKLSNYIKNRKPTPF
jgi:glutathione S-transferase